MTATPALTTSGPDPLASAINTDGLQAIADSINLKTDALAKAAGTGRDRLFRTFRTAEVAEISGATDKQVRDWRRKNKATLAAYQASGAGSHTQALPQLPLTLAEMHRMMGDLGLLPRRPAGSRALRLGCFNFKGGSTKSSSALHLAVYFAMHGWRTLAIDADPQGSLSSMFGFSPEDTPIEHTLLPALRSVASQDLFENVALEPLKTHVDGLDLVPANLDMIGADFEVTAAFMNRIPAATQFYNCVSNAIRHVEDRYDLIVIDGAPAFSFGALATMWAADGMIIPVPPASPDFKATASFCSMAATGLESLARRAGQPDREWAPVMFLHNRVKPQGESSKFIRSMSSEAFGRYKLDEYVPDSTIVPNALARQMSIFEATGSAIDSRGLKTARDAYSKVALRVLDAVHAAWRAGFAAEGS